MLGEIKNSIEAGLRRYARTFGRRYGLTGDAAVLAEALTGFMLRPGKRFRPALFMLGYRCFCRRQPAGLLESALSIELLHDFMLIHDDIIDRSLTRRGKPSMHAVFDAYLKRFKNLKFNGQDLAIVAADVLYAAAMDAFLRVDEDPRRKEKALRQFIHAALYTGTGEFNELVCSAKKIAQVSREAIYAVYDYKTAYYTFAYPLSIGATLAGASESQVKAVFSYGRLLGRAFQIKDDILGVFGNERAIGKSTASDIREAKKTILVWYAYRHAAGIDREKLQRLFHKPSLTPADIRSVKRIMSACAAQAFAQTEIARLIKQANVQLSRARLAPRWRSGLIELSRLILT